MILKLLNLSKKSLFAINEEAKRYIGTLNVNVKNQTGR